MRRIDRFKNSVRRLKSVAFGFVLVLFAASASGQSGGSVNVNASSIRHTATTATGVRTAVTVDAVFTGTVNGTRHYNVPAVIPASRIGQLAKGALRRVLPGVGWYMTAKAIIDGAGWAIDELGQQVTDGPARDQDMVPSGTRMYCIGYAGSRVCSTNGASLNWVVQAVHWPVTESYQDGPYWRYKNKEGNSFLVALTTVNAPTPNEGTGHTPREISDADLGNLLKTSPQVVNAVLIDPDTGAPIRIPELVQALNDLRKSLEAANGLTPGSDVLPTDDITKTEPKESAWPDFCGWATTVCDWLDWTRSEGEPEKDLPEMELKIDPNGWSSGVGGGSCPAPETFTIVVVGQQAQGQFDWQPSCDFAIQFRPLFIAVCSIVAVFILAGLRSGAK